MDADLTAKILAVLDARRDMTLATLRPDGWPQATTVGFAHEGLTIYFLCGSDSQKARNLARDDRVSATIDGETDNVMAITGVSLAARAEAVSERDEVVRVIGLLFARYGAVPGREMPMPDLATITVFKLTPIVISVLDYSKGFGHADLVTC